MRLKINPNEWVPIFQSPPIDTPYYTVGSGGALVIDKKDLYFTIGDYSFDRKNNLPTDFAAQNIDLPFGKLLKIPDYEENTRPEIFSLGLRNPQGLTIDNGIVALTDHGPRGGDGFIFASQGANYGWPFESYGTQYFTYRSYNQNLLKLPNDFGNDEDCKFNSTTECSKYLSPTFVFIPSVAPSSIIKIKSFSPLWNEDYLIGTLKDLSLIRVHIRNSKVLYTEKIFLNERIRDLNQSNGKIFALTDSGKLLVIKATSTDYSQNLSASLIGCSNCHNVNPNNAQESTYAGPSLIGVYLRKIASTSYNYSRAFYNAKNKGIWDEENLTKFHLNPNDFIPGTAMPSLNQSLDNKDIQIIIESLKNISK